MNHLPPLAWESIKDLPDNWHQLASSELPTLGRLWDEQAQHLKGSTVFNAFMAKMRRKIAIETGIIERLYTLDRGITQILIEEGIDAALIPHRATDKPVHEVVALIRDQEEAVDWLFGFVKAERNLSTAYIRELHQFLTRHQKTTKGMDQFGNYGEYELERGVWKTLPNNPTRLDGQVYHYCPPVAVAAEMDRLIAFHLEHTTQNVPPEVEAAWLHHRFTRIHPFQDGNGRVARLLASLIFIRAGWFPLTITDDDRVAYIGALEGADYGSLKPLVDLFTKRQKQAFLSALSLSAQVLQEYDSARSIISAAVGSLAARSAAQLTEQKASAERHAARLFETAENRLDAIQQDIKSVAQRENVRDLRPRLAFGKNDDPVRRVFNRHQVIETARKLEYFANIVEYHSWVALVIQLGLHEENSTFEILLSFHVLGRENRGLYVCSACAYWKDVVEEGGIRLARDVKPLSETPFQFSYADSTSALESRFVDWIDDVSKVGLEYWRKGL